MNMHSQYLRKYIMLRKKLLGTGGALYVMEKVPFAIWFHLELKCQIFTVCSGTNCQETKLFSRVTRRNEVKESVQSRIGSFASFVCLEVITKEPIKTRRKYM